MTASTTSLALATGVVFALAVRALLGRKSRDRAQALPPGPPGLPFLGNLFQLDAKEPWLAFTRWKEIYGDIVYCKLLGQDIVVLNSHETAVELLDKRSANYSDRMWGSSMLQSYQLDDMIVFLPHDDKWRAHRRLLHQGLRQDAVKMYYPSQMQGALDLVENIKGSPEAYYTHIRRFTASVILRAVYDHRLDGDDDAVLRTLEEGIDLMNRNVVPVSAILSTMLPVLRYIPSWAPGGWRNAAQLRHMIREMLDMPFASLEQRLASGEAGDCFGTNALERFRNTDKVKDFETIVKDACGFLYLAGEETTASSLSVFILAMVLYPEVQKRAQDEIDIVVGTDRLPDFTDRPSLPYLEALYRETLRWRPVVPPGVPHVSTNDDIFQGHYIPKGTIIIANVWAMSQNPEIYPDPSAFKPERFFDQDGNLNDDTVDYAFGFGRRICPGRHVASGSIWAAIANILASFRIEPAKDAAGNTVKIEDIGWSCASTVCPKPFPCSIFSRK